MKKIVEYYKDWRSGARDNMNSKPYQIMVLLKLTKSPTFSVCHYWGKRDRKERSKRGAPCHEVSPRGSSGGTQGLKNKVERARIPDAFCEHIVKICEEEV